MQVSSMHWVSVFKGGRVGIQLTFSFSPSDMFFIYLFFFSKMLISAFIVFLNINAPIIIIIISLCFTFAEPFDDIFSSSSQVVHWSVEIQTKVYNPRKEERKD